MNNKLPHPPDGRGMRSVNSILSTPFSSVALGESWYFKKFESTKSGLFMHFMPGGRTRYLDGPYPGLRHRKWKLMEGEKSIVQVADSAGLNIELCTTGIRLVQKLSATSIDPQNLVTLIEWLSVTDSDFWGYSDLARFDRAYRRAPGISLDSDATVAQRAVICSIEAVRLTRTKSGFFLAGDIDYAMLVKAMPFQDYHAYSDMFKLAFDSLQAGKEIALVASDAKSHGSNISSKIQETGATPDYAIRITLSDLLEASEYFSRMR